MDHRMRRLTHDNAGLVSSYKTNLLRRDDLISGLVLEHAVLVNATLMRKCIGSYNGLQMYQSWNQKARHSCGMWQDRAACILAKSCIPI